MRKKCEDIVLRPGMRMSLISGQIGKPMIAYVVSSDELDHLVKMSVHWPYKAGEHAHFFVNRFKLKRHWRSEIEGVQTEIGI